MNGYGGENVDQLLRVVADTAERAKNAGLDYRRGWLAAWPGGVSPDPSQSGPILDEVTSLARRLKAAVTQEEATRMNGAIDERGEPGLNSGYQYWVRQWPGGVEIPTRGDLGRRGVIPDNEPSWFRGTAGEPGTGLRDPANDIGRIPGRGDPSWLDDTGLGPNRPLDMDRTQDYGTESWTGNAGQIRENWGTGPGGF